MRSPCSATFLRISFESAGAAGAEGTDAIGLDAIGGGVLLAAPAGAPACWAATGRPSITKPAHPADHTYRHVECRIMLPHEPGSRSCWRSRRDDFTVGYDSGV